MRGYKGLRIIWAMLVLLTFLAVGLASGPSQAADPEPKLVKFPDKNYDPGPGWPAGWSPPVMPTTISPERQAQYEEIRAKMPKAEQPDQLKFYDLGELPKWTQQYPYFLKFSYTLCGKTVYLYYYPYPDLELTTQMTGKINPGVTENSGGDCGIASVAAIKQPREMTAQEREQWNLADDLHADRRAAKKGLDDCNEWTNASPNNIYVCFNAGAATPLFDAPAYLDTSVGRVRVPVRFVSELMGASVSWDDASQTVTISFPGTSREIAKLVLRPGYVMADWWRNEYHEIDSTKTMIKKVTVSQPAKTIMLTVGSNVATVDGKQVALDAPPVLVPPGRVMVPIRFISEQLGAKVFWVGDQPTFPRGNSGLTGIYQVHVYTPFHPLFDGPDWYLENRAMKV